MIVRYLIARARLRLFRRRLLAAARTRLRAGLRATAGRPILPAVQAAALLAMAVSVGLLAGWRWGLLTVSLLAVVVTVRMEMTS